MLKSCHQCRYFQQHKMPKNYSQNLQGFCTHKQNNKLIIHQLDSVVCLSPICNDAMQMWKPVSETRYNCPRAVEFVLLFGCASITWMIIVSLICHM